MRKEVESVDDLPSTSSDFSEPTLRLNTSLTDLISKLDTSVFVAMVNRNCSG